MEKEIYFVIRLLWAAILIRLKHT